MFGLAPAEEAFPIKDVWAMWGVFRGAGYATNNSFIHGFVLFTFAVRFLASAFSVHSLVLVFYACFPSSGVVFYALMGLDEVSWRWRCLYRSRR